MASPALEKAQAAGMEAEPEKLDAAVSRALTKGRANHEGFKPTWAECLAFLENRQFVYKVAKAKRIDELETAEGGSKPRYRARTTRNFFTKHIMAEVSAGIQRVPGYDSTPTTTDPDDVSAARLSEKVLLDLYDRLMLRKHLTIALIYSRTCAEGFVRPYWNEGAGKQYEDGSTQGEIAVEVYGPEQVFWEAGCRYEQSPWLAIEKAYSIDQVKALPGYNGCELQNDVKGSSSLVSGQLSRRNARPDSVLVTEYLELPSEKHPKGRRMFIANNKLVCETTDYPDPVRGQAGWEHGVLKLSYIPTPHRDRDLGLGELLLDPQRTVNDVVNKAIQWKNFAIRPQMMAPVGSIIDRLTDEEGTVIRYRPIAGMKPEWREAPPIPPSLFAMKDDAKADMQDIASQHSVPPGIESGKGLEAVYEQDQSVTAFIIQNLADFHAMLGRHLLLLVQKYYADERLIQLSGQYSPDANFIARYKGKDIRNQVNIRVSAASIEPRTRQSMEAKIFALVDRQMIPPDVGLRAIEGGYAENLIADYELDVAKQDREIYDMVLLGFKGETPEEDELPGGDIPIAAPYDNDDVHLDVLHRWMKTKDFEDQPPQVKEAATLHEQQHQEQKAAKDAQAAAAQTQIAEQLGMANATRTPAKGMPSAPSPDAPPQGQQPIPA